MSLHRFDSICALLLVNRDVRPRLRDRAEDLPQPARDASCLPAVYSSISRRAPPRRRRCADAHQPARTQREWSGATGHQRLEAVPHCGQGLAARAQRPEPQRPHPESSASIGRHVRGSGRRTMTSRSPWLRAGRGSVQRAHRERSSRPALDFEPDRHAVGVLAEPQHGQQHDVLELAEMFAPAICSA